MNFSCSDIYQMILYLHDEYQKLIVIGSDDRIN